MHACKCIHTYIHTCIHTYTFVCIHTYVCSYASFRTTGPLTCGICLCEYKNLSLSLSLSLNLNLSQSLSLCLSRSHLISLSSIFLSLSSCSTSPLPPLFFPLVLNTRPHLSLSLSLPPSLPPSLYLSLSACRPSLLPVHSSALIPPSILLRFHFTHIRERKNTVCRSWLRQKIMNTLAA
jgi:hypothetical protein